MHCACAARQAKVAHESAPAAFSITVSRTSALDYVLEGQGQFLVHGLRRRLLYPQPHQPHIDTEHLNDEYEYRFTEKEVSLKGGATALLGAEVLFIDIDIRCEFTPLPARASEDVTKLELLGIEKSGVIQRTCGNRANARNCLQRKPEIRSATRAEVDLQPSARLIRSVAVACRSLTGESDVLLLKHDLRTKRCASAALTPEAVANRDALWLTSADIAY